MKGERKSGRFFFVNKLRVATVLHWVVSVVGSMGLGKSGRDI